MSWRVDFEPTGLLPAEQPAITTAVTTARNNIQALRPARYAVVYSAGGLRWWHTSRTDPREHVTVRFLGLNRPTRVHVYRDGTASIRPPSETSGTKRAPRDVGAQDEGEDTPEPFSDEEIEVGADLGGVGVDVNVGI